MNRRLLAWLSVVALMTCLALGWKELLSEEGGEVSVVVAKRIVSPSGARSGLLVDLLVLRPSAVWPQRAHTVGGPSCFYSVEVGDTVYGNPRRCRTGRRP